MLIFSLLEIIQSYMRRRNEPWSFVKLGRIMFQITHYLYSCVKWHQHSWWSSKTSLMSEKLTTVIFKPNTWIKLTVKEAVITSSGAVIHQLKVAPLSCWWIMCPNRTKTMDLCQAKKLYLDMTYKQGSWNNINNTITCLRGKQALFRNSFPRHKNAAWVWCPLPWH